MTMGAVTQEFEQSFAETQGVKHALAVSNATEALHLAKKRGRNCVIAFGTQD